MADDARSQREDSGAALAAVDGSRHPLLGAVALLIVSIAVFLPALHGEFIWDDLLQIVNNTLIHSGEGLRQIWTEPSANRAEGHYWPLVYTSFWMDHRLWGLEPFGFHLHNIMLHGLNAVLLWCLLRRMAVPGSWLAAAVFAVHPVHVEAVAWIMERKDVLSAFFYLLAFLAYLSFERDRRPVLHFLSLLLFVAALLSKSITISLPLAIGLWLWWKKPRLEMRDLLPLIPFVVTGAVIASMDIWLMHEQETGSYPFTLLERVLIAGRASWFYAGKLVWPAELLIIYSYWRVETHAAWQYVFPLAAVAVLCGLWLARRRIGKGPLACVLFFGITLGPNLGFIDYSYMGISLVANRYQYLASIGLIALFAALFTALFDGSSRFRGRLSLHRARVVVALLAVLGALTWSQSALYRNTLTLFKPVLARDQTVWMAHHVVGAYMYDEDRVTEAANHFSEVIRLRPDHHASLQQLGIIRAKQEQYTEAVKHLDRALRVKPGREDTLMNLALALRRDGRPAASAARYVELFARGYDDEWGPHYATANNLAWTLATDPDEALRDGATAVRLAAAVSRKFGRTRPTTLGTLAAAYAESGRFEEAVATAERVLAAAEAASDADLVAGTRERLALYRSGRAYRQTPE